MITLTSFNEEFSNIHVHPKPSYLISAYTRQHLCQKISSKIIKTIINFYGTSFFSGTKGWKFMPPMTIIHKKDKIKHYYYQNIVVSVETDKSHPFENKSFEELRFEDQQNTCCNSEPNCDEAKIESLDSDDSDDSDNAQNDTEEKQENLNRVCCVVIGGYVQEFPISDLTGIDYFANCLSDRWNPSTNDKKREIVIDTDGDNAFDLEELEAIIKCQRYQKIDTSYHISRIPKLLSALDYFQETIDNNIFYQYLLIYPSTFIPNNITFRRHSNLCENKALKEFRQATTKYRDVYKNLSVTLTEKFVEKWVSLPINTLVKMKNISYLILMKTLKLAKQDFSSKDADAVWYERDCIITLQFVKRRSFTDFNQLWKAMVNSDNFRYMFDVLSLLITAWSQRKSLLTWHNVSRAGNRYENDYRNVSYECNIRDIFQQMITHVFQAIIRKNTYCDVSSELNAIIYKFVNILEMDQDLEYVTSLYKKLIHGYFDQCDTMNAAITMLFEDCFKNKRVLLKTTCLGIFDDDSKDKTFFENLCKLSLMEINAFKQSEIYEFFIKMHKEKSFEYISCCLSKNVNINGTFIKFVKMFVKTLKYENDEATMTRLSTTLIDNHLLKCMAVESLVQLIIALYEFSTINNKFQQLDEVKKVDFLKYLFGLCKKTHKDINKFGVFILKKNMKEAIETFEYWFSILMIEQKDWIISSFLNQENVCFIHLEKILETVSNMLLNSCNEKDDIPIEYFECIDKIMC